MKFMLFKKEDQPVTKWTGGTTIQFLIYPFDSSLTERNFTLRISSATVETETSVFTDFSGFSRILMILEGVLKIKHESNETKTLRSFEPYQFDGGRKTSAEGIVTDFNVIWNSKLKNVSLFKIESDSILQVKQHQLTAVYCYKGGCTIDNKNLEEGNLLFIHDIAAKKSLPINSSTDTILLVTKAELV